MQELAATGSERPVPTWNPGYDVETVEQERQITVVEVGTNNLKRALKSKEIEIYRLLLRTLLKISPSSRIIACEIFKRKAIDNGRV
jgi:hypothetical protein